MEPVAVVETWEFLDMARKLMNDEERAASESCAGHSEDAENAAAQE